MESPSRSSRKNRAEMTTSLISFSPACQTCIKNRTTRVALMVAMVSATAALKGPRSRRAANTVSPVPTSRAIQTAKYMGSGEEEEWADEECPDMGGLTYANRSDRARETDKSKLCRQIASTNRRFRLGCDIRA